MLISIILIQNTRGNSQLPTASIVNNAAVFLLRPTTPFHMNGRVGPSLISKEWVPSELQSVVSELLMRPES